MIDISNYLLNLNSLTNLKTISNKLDEFYNNIINYLSYYNKKINYYNNLINDLNSSNQINFNFAQYLGHNFFEYFTLEIGGQEFETYSQDFLHIHQMHSINQDYMNNYLELIGHIDTLNNYNKDTKGNSKVIVPLIFWFNRDPGLSLPIVSMQYSNIKISTKINDIKNIICFADFEYVYDDILNINVEMDNEYKLNSDYIINNNLLFKNYKLDINYKTINYQCLYINNTLLKLKFMDITTDEINFILTNYGEKYDSIFIKNINNKYIFHNNIDYYLIDKFHWIKFMMNLNSYPFDAYKITSYYSYIDYNLLYSLIDVPQIKLIGEFIFFDDLERGKFADSKLEYVIETYEEDLYNIVNNISSFECDISIDNPCKELLWFIKPNIFINGINKYGKNLNLLFNISNYFKNSLIKNQNISIDNNLLLINSVTDNYYTYLLSYKYFNNILPNDIYYYSFCLYPEQLQPSGTINFKYIKGKQYSVTFNNNFIIEYNDVLNLLYSDNSNMGFILKIYAKCYNLLVIHKGVANLFFNNF